MLSYCLLFIRYPALVLACALLVLYDKRQRATHTLHYGTLMTLVGGAAKYPS